MKCRFCGKKLRKGSDYCPKCGKRQTVDALPDGDFEDYEEYVDVTYTDYEEPVVFDDFDTESDYTPPVQPKKKAQPRLPLIPLIAVALVALVLVLFLGRGREYDLLWPDLRAYLGQGNYVTILETSRRTPGNEEDKDKTGYIYEIWIPADQREHLDAFMEMVEEEYHFDLDEQRDEYWFYRHEGTNAPDPATSLDAKYHAMIAIVEEDEQGALVRVLWADTFALDTSRKAENNDVQRPESTKPVETKPVETKPVETKPVETKPVETKPVETKPVETTEPEPEFGASFLPYFLDEDRSGKFYLNYTEKLSDGDRVLFKADAISLEYAVEAYLEMMYDMGYTVVRTDHKDRSNRYYREWYLTCEGLPDSGKDWHVHVNLQNMTEGGYTNLIIDMIGGVKMDQVLPENGGGGGGSEWDDDDDGYRPDCAMCNGSGRCGGCGGDGYKWSYGMDREKLNCSDCNASGRCWYCGGSGKR